MMVAFEAVRALALALPGAEEGLSYGTPAFKVRGKLFARLREEGDVLVVKIDPEYRDVLLATEPECFFVTPHYAGYPSVLVRLGVVEEEALRALLADAWRMVAPKRLLAAFDARPA